MKLTPSSGGVSALFDHVCGHTSAPMYYASAEYANNDRARQEAAPCWPCRNAAASAAPTHHKRSAELYARGH